MSKQSAARSKSERAAAVRRAHQAAERRRNLYVVDGASRNEYSSRAANAAMVVLDRAGTDAFWKFHDLLFSQQPEEGTAGPDNDELVDLAVEAGAAREEVATGVEDGEFDQWVVNATNEMSKNGVTGTPTALIDGKIAGATPAESIAAVLDAVK